MPCSRIIGCIVKFLDPPRRVHGSRMYRPSLCSGTSLLSNSHPSFLMADEISSGSVFPDNIDLYPAGPELDALLAERVLGARVRRYKEGWSGYENWIVVTPDGEELYIELSPHSVYGGAPLWNPSTNLSDAQVLVRQLYMHSNYRTLTQEVTEEIGYAATLWAQRPVDNEVTGAHHGDRPQHVEAYCATGTGLTPALAVCRAVYKAASDMRLPQIDENNR
jgi:hypothetical protein